MRFSGRVQIPNSPGALARTTSYRLSSVISGRWVSTRNLGLRLLAEDDGSDGYGQRRAVAELPERRRSCAPGAAGALGQAPKPTPMRALRRALQGTVRAAAAASWQEDLREEP